ncbi:hypothetical protein [uncultured Pseudokineococcus sp.]|uniref:hypothetical protein n=1 Tax=uncultured Pseudokineococcus sp. TaxID=1642928 RepID=UPI002631FC05|nr:hypothetical protein [uncultured Pseudokineococcus sp.]
MPVPPPSTSRRPPSRPGGPGARTRAWWLLRAYLNLVPSAAALAWGVAHGGRVVVGRDLVVECGGMRGGYARGGTTVGSVWLHGDLGGERRRRHEARHADQWALLGPVLMPLLYGLEAALTGGDPRRSRFERGAGLADGGYEPPSAHAGPTPREVRVGRARRR